MTARTRGVKEATVERELCQRVMAAGGLCVKVTVPGRRGHPDRLVILPGPRLVMVETKRPRGGIVAPHQSSWLKTYARLGVAIAVVRNSADIDALLNPTRKPSCLTPGTPPI